MTIKQKQHLRTLRNERTRLVSHLIMLRQRPSSELVVVGISNCQREMARINEGIRRMEALR